MEKRYPNKSHEQSVGSNGRVRLKYKIKFCYGASSVIFNSSHITSAILLRRNRIIFCVTQSR
jgi:hypothetical protein